MMRVVLTVLALFALALGAASQDAVMAATDAESAWEVHTLSGGGELRYLIPTMSDADYPPRARRLGIEGQTKIMLLLSPEGEVLECSAYQSSGDAELDERACALMRERAHFELRGTSENVKVGVPITWRLRSAGPVAADPSHPLARAKEEQVASSGQTSQSILVTKVEKWTIFRSVFRIGGSCYAAAEFVGGEIVAIYYDASDQKTWLLFTNSDARFLKNGEKKVIDIMLQRPDGTPNDRWKQTEFTVLIDNETSPTFVSELLDEPALSDFKEATYMALVYNGQRIDAYNFNGAGAALEEVERCSSRLLDASQLVPNG